MCRYQIIKKKVTKMTIYKLEKRQNEGVEPFITHNLGFSTDLAVLLDKMSIELVKLKDSGLSFSFIIFSMNEDDDGFILPTGIKYMWVWNPEAKRLVETNDFEEYFFMKLKTRTF